FFFSSRRRHTRFSRDWSSDVCSSDLDLLAALRHHDVMILAADWQAGNVQAALAYHLGLDAELAVNDDRAALVTLEAQLHAYRTGMVDHLLGQSRQRLKRQFAFEYGSAIGQLAWINVRWNRPIQHRREILGS